MSDAASPRAPDELLADYAAGATSPGLSLLLATYLTGRPAARRRLGEMEAIGGALLAEGPPAELSSTALDRALAAIGPDAPGRAPDPAPKAPAPGARVLEDGVARPPATEAAEGPLPLPLIRWIGIPFGRIPWRFRLPGLAEYPLPGFDGEHVSLVRARPGARLPRHTHRGLEATLVLQGCLRDEEVDFRAGDLSISDDSVDHRPRIIGPLTCYCLLVLEGGTLRYTGRFARLLNWLAP